MVDELTSDECYLLMGAIERQVEYGYSIALTKDLIKLYDKLDEMIKRKRCK